MTRSSGFSTARLRRMSDVMRSYIEDGKVAGVVTALCRHGEMHIDAAGMQDLGAGTPMQRNTVFRIASMTKPVTAAAAMILVEETQLRLDELVDRFLPELADRRVLRATDSPLDDTVPAARPITLRDLLTFRLGLGAIMVPGPLPIQQAIKEAGIAPGPDPLAFSPDEFMRRVGGLPLVHQPGERWMYHTGSDILGVLIARASGMKLEDFLRERIFAPLGMKDTAFSVPDSKLDRLAASYRTDAQTGSLTVHDPARGGKWAQPPIFASGGGGLVSTAEDFLAFGRMMLNFGRHGAARILSRPAIELMTMDHLTQAQKDASPFFPGFWDNRGWGFGFAVTTRRDGLGTVPGQYGWMGGFGTTWWSDPREDMVAVLLIQRLMTGPGDTDINDDFMTLAYQAIDD